jgi:hypothetical protein
MNAYETSTTVESSGQIRLGNVPFAPGTEVEISISPKRGSSEDFGKRWNQLCQQMRARAGEVTDLEIESEVDAFRARQ